MEVEQMKKMILLIMILVVLIGCSNNKELCYKTEEGQYCSEFKPYGLLDEEVYKNPNIEYRINPYNVFWSIVLIESIFAPIIIIGFDIYEPVRVKTEPPMIKSK